MRKGYLKVKASSTFGRQLLLGLVPGSKERDLQTSLWGEEQLLEIAMSQARLPGWERTRLMEGGLVEATLPVVTLSNWASVQLETRLEREASISRTDKVMTALHKLFLREKRMSKAALGRVDSDILPHMDGSTLLWLGVILSAKKDFLRGHQDEDLESEDYRFAYGFLFNDNYTVIIEPDMEPCPDCNAEGLHYKIDPPREKTDPPCPTCNGFHKYGGWIPADTGKESNLEGILDTLIENCNSRSIDSSFVDPSITHLRASLAKKSGDSRLITLFCK